MHAGCARYCIFMLVYVHVCGAYVCVLELKVPMMYV